MAKGTVGDGDICCGLIMPISAIDGCSKQHWSDVHTILSDALKGAGFSSRLVSKSDDSGSIQKRIIQNLYEDPIVVCDVSGKNPNVMFELGIRLAFDKPTIIVKDDQTSYSFDTSSIEHLDYPRDLRFGEIVEFKELLKEKVVATYERSKTDPNYTTFLKHFGTFRVSKLDSKELTKEDYIIEELKELKKALTRRRRNGLDEALFPKDLRQRNGSREDLFFVMKNAISRAMAADFPDVIPLNKNDPDFHLALFSQVLSDPLIMEVFPSKIDARRMFDNVFEGTDIGGGDG